VHGGGFTRTVVAAVGAPWPSGTTTWRSLTWDPSDEPDGAGPLARWLPSFDAELGLHVAAGPAVTLVLDARYRPPGGPLGAVADGVVLQRVARGTIQWLLAEVAGRLAAGPGPNELPVVGAAPPGDRLRR
jgi:hypothetical protein